MIVVSHWQEDIDWLELYLGHIAHIVYTRTNSLATNNLAVNKGREAVVYLKYIVDNYENLADVTAFVHGHRTSWHQRSPDDIVIALRALKWGKYDYMPLTCVMTHTQFRLNSGDHQWTVNYQLWNDVLKQELGEQPRVQVNTHCCASFAVKKEKILSHPKSFYQNIHDYILNSKESDGKTGRTLEYSWHILFRQPHSIRYAMCDLFYCNERGQISIELAESKATKTTIVPTTTRTNILKEYRFPPAGFTQLKEREKAIVEKEVAAGNPEYTFLALGGFVYFKYENHQYRTLRTNALVQADNGLVFEGPVQWKSEFTGNLWKQGRFQNITISTFAEMGIKFYCFLNPGEILKADNGIEWMVAANGAFFMILKMIFYVYRVLILIIISDISRVQPTPSPCANKLADYVPSILIENLIQSSKTQRDQSKSLVDNHHDKIKTHVEETVKLIDNHRERIDNRSKQLDKHKNSLKFVYPVFSLVLVVLILLLIVILIGISKKWFICKPKRGATSNSLSFLARPGTTNERVAKQEISTIDNFTLSNAIAAVLAEKLS
ncbi:unnamed protein product [Didymodactylos carnosus]|uniref:Uncharacterized protein n=1 Tax=Didymodactylos carnosus TaxID=1234261 RepID=A0A813SV61_9BILA|nr:unnamed protein product [Didymodactylos carnosus]CAF3587467.1 unnamed protein product [Didymodactylos carnosus]